MSDRLFRMRGSGRAFFTGEKIIDLSMGSITWFSAMRHKRKISITAINNDYQRLFRKNFFDPGNINALAFKSAPGTGITGKFDGASLATPKEMRPSTIAGTHWQSCYFPSPTLMHTMSR